MVSRRRAREVARREVSLPLTVKAEILRQEPARRHPARRETRRPARAGVRRAEQVRPAIRARVVREGSKVLLKDLPRLVVGMRRMAVSPAVPRAVVDFPVVVQAVEEPGLAPKHLLMIQTWNLPDDRRISYCGIWRIK
ncbi:MAG: hypothetical protein KatS3mg112_1142 [Thermogutta sp.]|nr:MAG: hypothetical protein KatS3mg112_1142 [Thermogutta sp.]